MFGLFSGEVISVTHSTSLDEASDATAGTCPHRQRWTLSDVSWAVAVRCDVRRQRLRNDTALLVAALTRFTWSSVDLVKDLDEAQK